MPPVHLGLLFRINWWSVYKVNICSLKPLPWPKADLMSSPVATGAAMLDHTQSPRLRKWAQQRDETKFRSAMGWLLLRRTHNPKLLQPKPGVVLTGRCIHSASARELHLSAGQVPIFTALEFYHPALSSKTQFCGPLLSAQGWEKGFKSSLLAT